MKTVLFSPVGGTDPISNCRDGSILHICRNYRPDCVMLYLSREMLGYQAKDDRYRRSLRLLAEELGFEMEILEEERPELDNPHLFDLFYSDFESCIHKLHNLYPEHQLLVNMSSGTPAMKSALAVLTQLISLPVQGIQVSTPRHGHNGEREKLEDFDTELFWECNEDRIPEKYYNRCVASQQENLRAKLMRKTLIEHIKAYDYPAAVRVGKEMGALLPEEASELLNAALLRSQGEWRKIPQPNLSRLIERGNVKEQDIFEFMLLLQLRQKRGELSDFLRALTPALFSLSVYALVKATGVNLEAACNDQNELVRDRIPPEVLERLDRLYRGRFESKYISSDICIKLLEDMKPDHPYVQPLNLLRRIEYYIRNIAAHTIQPITEQLIERHCKLIAMRENTVVGNWDSIKISEGQKKYHSEDVMKLFMYCTETVLERRNPLKWNAYDLMNEDIERGSTIESYAFT